MNPAPFSEAEEVVLDRDGFEALAAHLIPIIAVASLRESERPVPLKTALRALRERRTRGVRVRYRHEGAAWLDTLIPTSDGGIRHRRVREG